MNALQLLLEEYLTVRHALGAKLKLPGRLLQRFVTFVAQHKADFITTELALQWATEPRDAQPAQWANRLGMVRRFAQYANVVDPRHEVPPPDLLPYRYHRPPPYIYRDEEVTALIDAAQGLPGFTGLRPYTCATLLGLVAVTGMRANEPLRLDRDDVDLTHARIVRGREIVCDVIKNAHAARVLENSRPVVRAELARVGADRCDPDILSQGGHSNERQSESGTRRFHRVPPDIQQSVFSVDKL